MKKNYATFSLVFIFLFSAAVNTQTISQLSFYSPLINTFDMKYTDNHLVVSQNGLLIFDVTNPTQKPKLIAQTTYPGSTAYAVAVQGNYAYMAFGNNGILAVYDITNFSAPLLKGSLAMPAVSFNTVGDIELHDNYAYLSGFDSLYVVNVSNPLSPVLANVIPVAHTEFTGAEDMAVEGNSLFIKTPFTIEVYDITSATAPALISSVPYLHAYNNMLVTDTVNHRLFLSWATVLKDFTGYDSYDVSNPSSPTYLFSDSTEFSPGDFGIMGYSYLNNVLYASRGGSINAFDVSASHHFVTNFSGEDIPNTSVSIQVRDSVFFHARGGGIEVLKYGSEAPPVCNTPENLKTRVNGTTANLTWNKVPGAKGYIVRYRKANNAWKIDSSINNLKRIDKLEPNSLYYWQVAAVCNIRAKQRSDFSSTERFNTGNAIALIVSPNPVEQNFKVMLNDISAKKLIIKNATGNTVMQLPFQNGRQISFANMITGAYTIFAVDENNTIIAGTTLLKK